jgi:hypothetical protein
MLGALRARPARFVAAWFVVLAVAVAGPLLLPGQLLLLDFPSGPRFPDLRLFPLPSSGQLGNDIAVRALHVLVRSLSSDLPAKFFLVGSVVVGGIGIARLLMSRLRTGPIAAACGGTLYAVNPFVYDRMISGQLYVVAAYAVLPWASTTLLDVMTGRSRRPVIFLAVWLAGLAAIDLHLAGAFGLVLLLSVPAKHAREHTKIVALSLLVAAPLCAYWLFRAALARPGVAVAPYELGVYASRPAGWLVVPNLVALGGFWRTEFEEPMQRVPALLLLLAPLLALVALGGAHLVRERSTRAWAMTIGGGGLLGIAVAAGVNTPVTGAVFRWLFFNVPGFAIYREPQKLLALLALAYAIGVGVGVDRVVRTRRVLIRASVGAAAVLVVLAYGYLELGGLWGQVHLSSYPQSWREADATMSSASAGGVLVFPWVPYAVWSFSDGRIVANPAGSYFSRPTLVQDGAGSREPPPLVDPFRRYIDEVLRMRDKKGRFGGLVAPLDVRFIVWLKEVDWWRYAFLKHQTDLRSIYAGEKIEVFENEAWQPDPRPLSASRANVRPPIVPPVRGWFPSIGQSLPGWTHIRAAGDELIATGQRCTDGWRLGSETPSCLAGAAAVFQSPERSRPLWRPQKLTDALALLLSLGALAVCVAMVLKRDRPRERPRQRPKQRPKQRNGRWNLKMPSRKRARPEIQDGNGERLYSPDPASSSH